MVAPSDQADLEWEQLIAGMGEDVEPDTYMKPGEQLQSSGQAMEQGWAARVNSLDYKGYVRVWDNRTGVMSLQPRWLLWQTMQKTREDGSRVFTLADPKIPQQHGADLICPLHPDSPDHDRFVAMGFRTCKKQHIPHQDGLTRHIRKSHPRVLAVIEQEKIDRERQEDRDLQRENLLIQRETLRRLTGTPSETVEPAEVPDEQLAEVIAVVEHIETGDGTCLCGWQSYAKKKQSRKLSLKQHIASKT